MRNQHVDDLLDAYALGALEPAEVDAVERHLAGCAQCRALAEQARAAAATLIYAAPSVTPPPSLRARLLERIAAERRGAQPPSPSGVTPVAPARVPRAQRGAPGGNLLARLLHGLRGESASAARQADPLLSELLADPRCVVLPVAGTDAAPGAGGRLVSVPARREGVLVTHGLPPAGPAHAYQVWFLRGGVPQPNALFTSDRAGRGVSIVRAREALGHYETIAVTPEPEGGSPGPTGPIVLAGAMVRAAGG